MRAFVTFLFVLSFILLSVGLISAQEAITFQASDGYRLHADLYGKGDRAVVLAHGGRFTRESWRKQAEAFADAGFRVLTIDFRGYGQSWELGTKTEDWKHYPDVLAAVRYLHNAGAKSVSVVGASLGGDAAGDAASESNQGEIDRIILLGSEGGDSPERLKGRKLFIVTRDDKSGDGPRLPGITEHYRKAPDPKKLVVLEGSAHAQFIFDTDQGPRLLQEMLGFLSEP
jgi:alpha-beta hydrolase superfamily lysophospholipase